MAMNEFDDWEETIAGCTCLICGKFYVEEYTMPKPSENCEMETICDECQETIRTEWIDAHIDTELIVPRHKLPADCGMSKEEFKERAGLILLDFITEHADDMRPFISYLKDWLEAGNAVT